MTDLSEMIAEWNGAEIARSANCIVCESTIYFPLADLRREFIRPGIFRSHCPRKGEAVYFDLSVRGRGLTHAAWHYPAPDRAFAELTDRVAFWRDVEVREAESATHAASRAHADDRARLTRTFVSRIPKTEIHLRLESFATGDVVVDPAALLRKTRDYLKRNRIFYAEIFCAPALFASRGMGYDELADELDAAARRIKAEDRIHVRFLIDVSQNDGLPAAEKILDSILAHTRDAIIGVATSGPETAPGKSPRVYAAVLDRARAAGLRVVSMAGEMLGPSHVWDALRNIPGVERLGHATSAILDERLLDDLRQRQIPLTICPSSNAATRAYIHELREHPIRAFFERGLNVSVNSDCPARTGAELTDEYMNLYEACGFDLNEIIVLMRNNLNASFLSPRNKTNCWKQIEDRIRSLQTELNLEITIP